MTDIILDEIYWPFFNERDHEIILNGSKGTPFHFPPGARLVLPKQVEALNAVRKYKATLLSGAMGSGKSIAGEACIHDLLMEWSAPGHTHGMSEEICNVQHEGMIVFLIGQSLQDILRRNHRDWMDRFSDFGEFNKQSREFTYHDSYGSHVVMHIGSDDPKKIRGTKAAAAFHDECTLDSDFLATFRMTMKRLRQAGIPHRPWIGATNTTGPSRESVKRLFVDAPMRDPKTGRYPPYTKRPTMYDEAKKKYFPGYTHIHSTVDDNPFIDDDTRREMLEGSEFEVQAYYYGSWEHPEGAAFHLEPGIHIVADYDIPENWPGWLSVDFGYDHPTVCSTKRMDPLTGRFVHDLVWSMDKMTAKDAKIAIYQYLEERGRPLQLYQTRVGDVSGKRGEAKMAAAGYLNSSDWKIFNMPTVLGKHKDGSDIIIPSFGLRPAYKARIPGWKAVREGFAYKWEWRQIDKSQPISPDNRKIYVTEPPLETIMRSCWQTISSFSVLQKDPNNPDDCKKTLGMYGPAKGDDESENYRYLTMAAVKRMYGKSESNPIDEIARTGAAPYMPQNMRRRPNELTAAGGASVWAR